MKIRLDFVSNSSSSSFMLVGYHFDDDDVHKFAKRLGWKPEDPDDEETYEAIEFIQHKFPDMTYHRGIADYDEHWCIGYRYSDMKNDETRAEFEGRVADLLHNITGYDNAVAVMVDGGYDG